jgi:hypothetical protein
MSRQYFADLPVEPPTLNPLAAAIVATSETLLWPTALFSPINIGDLRAGKVYRLSAGGIWSTGASGSLTITPRIGTSTGGATLGASPAQTVPVSVTNAAWSLDFIVVVRSVGLAGANSTAIGSGRFIGSSGGAAVSPCSFAMGGTVATFDASIAEGLAMGWTLSVAGSCTPQWVTMQSLN